MKLITDQLTCSTDNFVIIPGGGGGGRAAGMNCIYYNCVNVYT